MKKSFKAVISAIFAAAMTMVFSLTAFAEDYVFDVSSAKTTAGGWAQSFIYYTSLSDPGSATSTTFNPLWMTSESDVIVTYTTEGTYNSYPCELIWQTWDSEEEPAPGIKSPWNKIAPSSFDETTATFTYSDIVAGYGTDNFKDVFAICVGDTGNQLLVTGVTITNCNITLPEPAETTAAEEDSAAEESDSEETDAEEETDDGSEENDSGEVEEEETTVKETEAETKATTTEKVTTAAKETEDDGGTLAVPSMTSEETGSIVTIIILIVVGIAVLAGVIALIIFIIKKSKGKYY